MYSFLIRHFIKVLLASVVVAMLSGCSASVPPKPAPEPDATAKPSQKLLIAAVGDIMLDGSAREIMRREGYAYAFNGTREWLQRADIAFGNLEGPLTRRGVPAEDKKYLFRSPPDEVVKSLADAGFDVVSLANNHSLDYGAEGLSDTIAALDKGGIRHVGAGDDLRQARQSTIIVRNGLRVAFLGYSLTFPEEFWAGRNRPGTAFGHKDHIVDDVKKARTEADIVVVSFHWGRESTTELRPYQTWLGREAIDAGAALVIGHHPHILQAVERYKDGVILYSMGNFAFGSYSQKARHSAFAEIEFEQDKLTQVRLLPINVLNVDVLFQPTALSGKQADKVVEELQQLSGKRGTTLVNEQGIAVLKMKAESKPPRLTKK